MAAQTDHAAHGHHHAGTQRHCIGTQCHGLGNIRAIFDSAGDDQADFLPDAHFLQGPHRLHQSRKGGNPQMRGGHHRCGTGAAFGTVDDNSIGTGFGSNFDVFLDASGGNFNKDGDLPVGYIAQFLNFEHHVVGPENITMARMAVQIDAFRQLPESRNFFGDFAAHQMAGQSGFGADTADDFDRICSFDVF